MALREWRFNRNMRRREQHLRFLEKSSITIVHHESKPSEIPTEWPKEGGGGVIPTPVEKTPHKGKWECTFCRREFHSFPSLLNHDCWEED